MCENNVFAKLIRIVFVLKRNFIIQLPDYFFLSGRKMERLIGFIIEKAVLFYFFVQVMTQKIIFMNKNYKGIFPASLLQ